MTLRARTWTTPAAVRARVRKSWDSGRLLASVVPNDAGGAAEAVGEEWAGGRTPASLFPLRVPLAGPRGADLADRWSDAREWVRGHEAAGGYRLEWRDVNDRTLGRQRLPTAAVIDSVADAAGLCGTKRELARFQAAVAVTPPSLLTWVRAHPMRVLEVGDDWPLLLGVVRWMADHPQPDMFLRQVDVPGVHTKVIEVHRRTIASMADALGVAGEPAEGHGWFERRYGFRTKPTMVRLRALDESARMLPGVSDLALRVDEAAGLAPTAQRVFVVENEINYLSFPSVPGAVVIFGHGNEAPQVLGRLPWLATATTHYWGDLDTHGFAILDRVRAVIPQVQSLLMDRATLLAHRHAWTTEPTPSSHAMTRLTSAEGHVVDSLRSGEFGPQVRLEQERIGWQWLLEAVEQACVAP